jgi:hypothetical protein
MPAPEEPGAALARLNEATRALADIASAADAVEVVRLAEAARAWAQQTRQGTTAINLAVIIKLRAAVRVADLVDAGQAAGEIATPADTLKRGPVLRPPENGAVSLEDIGVAPQRLKEYRTLRDEYGAGDLAGLQAHAAEIDEILSWAELLRRAGPGPFVGHNSGQYEWYTPEAYLDAARAVMGAIDLDPASTAEANKTVGAARYYTVEDDGLADGNPWAGRVWMNPPYSHPEIDRFSERLCRERDAGTVTAALVLVNNGTETGWFQQIATRSAAVCFPLGRLGGEGGFWHPSRPPASPLQGQAVLYLGDEVAAFVREFARFGVVAQVRVV